MILEEINEKVVEKLENRHYGAQGQRRGANYF